MFRIDLNEFVLRGALDDDRILWIPAEDVASLRRVRRIFPSHLRRAGLRHNIDYKTIDVRSELGAKLALNYRTGRPDRLLISEAGVYMVMMAGRGENDLQLRYWLADEVIPAIREYGTYNLPAGHPILGLLKDADALLKKRAEEIELLSIENRVLWERTDIPTSGLVGWDQDTTKENN